MAGSIGEFNAHAANILTAVFFGCWTGPSSKCGEFELYDIVSSFLFYCFYSKTHLLLRVILITITMPSIEVVMVPSSTFNTPVLEMLKHVHTQPTSNRTKATKFKRDALAAGHLIKAHMAHNRILGVLLLLVLVRLLVWDSGC